MANCHDLFLEFNSKIKLSDKNREMLKEARNSLRGRMKSSYNEFPQSLKKTHSIDFQSQGSFVMDTIIKPYSGDFDLDDGVYFEGHLNEDERSDTKVFHDLVIKSIDKDNLIEEIIDKPTCVRVKYFSNYKEQDLSFHIDLPIYYAEDLEIPELAHIDDGWIESSPVEFVAWFEEKTKSGFDRNYLIKSVAYAEPYEKWLSDIRKTDCQLRRIVRYMKSWANLKKKEMPCGIIMSILAANNYCEDARDDIALRDTLIAINNELEFNGIKCYRPTPKRGEDLFSSTTETDKEFFKKSLESFIVSAEQAINNPNKKGACLKWQKHLGYRFECKNIKDEIEDSDQFSSPAIITSSAKSG